MPECKNHPAFPEKSPISIAPSAIASTDCFSAAYAVLVRVIKPRAAKSNVSKNADPSDLERRLVEWTPECNVSLQRSQPYGALTVCKRSNGPDIQRRVNWRGGLRLPERACHDERWTEMSKGLTRWFGTIKYKHEANFKHRINRPGFSMYIYVAEGFKKKGASHERVLAG